MAQLRRDYQEFMKQDAEVLVFGPEDRQAFEQYWIEHKLPFIGLPDPQYRVLKLYGQEVSLFKLGRMPSQLIIDRQGMVRYAHYGNSMADIPSNQELLALLKEINNQ